MPLYRHLIRTIISLLAIALLAAGTAPKSFSQSCSDPDFTTIIATPAPSCDDNIIDLDFGQVDLLDSSAPQTITLNEDSFEASYDLSTNIEGDAADFSVSLDTNTLGPGGTAIVTVTCEPQNVGVRTAKLTIFASDTFYGEMFPPDPFEYILQCEVLFADLSITKVDDPDPVTVGEDLTYTITVTNNGTATAQNVVVTDDLPAGVTFLSTSSTFPISCSSSGLQVTCLLGNIPAGGSVDYTITVTVNSDAPSFITNTATVTADNDPDAATATETTVVKPPIQPEAMADLEIAKMASVNPVTAGGLLSYIITVTNNGPGAAENVVVTDNLPAGLQFVSSNSNCSLISDGSLFCPLGTLAAAESRVVMFTVQTPAGLSGQVKNTASVGSDTLDNNPGNNSSMATIQVNPPVVGASADISVAKSATATQIMPGDTFDYTLTVSNLSPNTAQNVTLFDPLPPGLTVLSASAGCTGVSNISCALGSLGAGASVAVVVTVQADAGVAGTLRNTVIVAAVTADPAPGNNMASVSVSVIDTPPTTTPLILLPAETVLPNASVGQPYSVTFSGTGGQPPLMLVGGNAPPGLGFSSGDGNQLILGGVPEQAGIFNVTVSLIDSAAAFASIVRNYTLTVGAELDILPRSLPVTQVGENFIVTFMTANGMPPDSFASIDPLPPGLALNGNSLTGIPSEVGDFSFTILASDSAGNQGMRNYTLSVLPAGLLILTDALPDAVVNASYGAQVLALGGVEPYRWRADSELPEGITFSDSGFFSGRPTVAGTFIVTVTVQDQARGSHRQG